MIPLETRLHAATQRASSADPVPVHSVVTLYPDSWVAIDIGMELSGCGDATLPQFFPAQQLRKGLAESARTREAGEVSCRPQGREGVASWQASRGRSASAV
jgi:hypothetical protein